MSYPAAPWTLHGESFLTLHPIDIAKAKPYIPREVDVFSIFPGKTLGVIYLASYKTGSVLEYNELIVAIAVNYQGNLGGWVSHIYVDNPDSMAGGREIWGLPKELAEFSWQRGDRTSITVRHDQQPLLTFSYDRPFSLWQKQFLAPSFSVLGTHIVQFEGQVDARLGWLNAQVEVSATSPIAPLDLGHPWLGIALEPMTLVVSAPKFLGKRGAID